MSRSRLAGVWICFCLLSGSVGASPEDEATLLRVFLRDGSSLVSFGEPSRVGDRVVFSLPTSASETDPQLHLVDIPADGVDWERTNRYAESARAARYVATHAESQYAMLTAEIGQVLHDVALTPDPAKRLAVVERARKMLAAWPAAHFNYRQADIQEMLAILDEAIVELRAAAGAERFDLSFVASVEPLPAREPLLPRPTPRDAIEQTLIAARLSDAPSARVSLMSVALAAIERDAVALPSDWRAATRAAVSASIESELATNRRYRALATRMTALAAERARAADVRGLQRLLVQIGEQDRTLGASRPDVIGALVLSVEGYIGEARRLQLELDRHALLLPLLRKYYAAVALPLQRLRRLKAQLEDIQHLAGSSPEALANIVQTSTQVLEIVTLLEPPADAQSSHTLLVGAARLAENAARVRREAALSGDMSRAWDASSAAAGALMLTDRAREEMESLLAPPGIVP
jgi:hypothetical protein